MNLRYLVPGLVFALGVSLVPQARADDFSTSGTFLADNSVAEINFTNSMTQTYTFTTTSVAAGGFLPVLTLFDASGNGLATTTTFADTDVTFSDTLDAGNYTLAVTEFPNGSNGTLASGFEFGTDPTITGDSYSMPGLMFIDDLTGAQRTDAYAVNAVTSAVTPEPATWLLCLPPLLLFAYARRRQLL